MQQRAEVMQEEERREILSAFDTSQLELILLPTEQCNFRCTYCYEDFEIGRVSDSVILGVKRLIAKRMPGLNYFRIQWFGGEPLVAKHVCLDISEYAYRLAEEHGVEFEGWFTTNGSLLEPDLLAKLVALRQRRFHVSLDGDRDMHNTTRIKANGSGTFDQIWGNLVHASTTDLDFTASLRLHVTRSNLESMERLVDKINHTFGDDPRFTTYFHKIENLGGPHASELKTLKEGEYESRANSLVPLVRDSNRDKMRESKKFIACYAAKGNSFIIRANGRVGKCTVLLSDPRNDVGYLTDDGRIILDAARVQPWMAGFKSQDWKTLSCPMGSVLKYPVEHKVDPPTVKKSLHNAT